MDLLTICEKNSIEDTGTFKRMMRMNVQTFRKIIRSRRERHHTDRETVTDAACSNSKKANHIDTIPRNWYFPHCIGAIDGKHVEIEPPPNTGLENHNYKKSFSMQ